MLLEILEELASPILQELENNPSIKDFSIEEVRVDPDLNPNSNLVIKFTDNDEDHTVFL